MKKKTKLSGLIISIISVAALGLGILSFYNPNPQVVINKNKIIVEVARTQIERRQGLSNRDELENNRGMLFLFDKKDSQIFWNNEIRFPIKLLWIAENKIIGVSDLPKDEGENILVHSPDLVDAVLEINDRTFSDFNIKTGDSIKINNVKKIEK